MPSVRNAPGRPSAVHTGAREPHIREFSTRGALFLIDRVGGNFRPHPIPAATPAPSAVVARQEPVDRASVSSFPPRAVFASAHACTEQWQEQLRFVDVASESLATIQDVLNEGAAGLAAGGPPAVGLLERIDQVAQIPCLAGEPALAQGVTLRVGASELSLRPISTLEIGAVIDTGRSLRLADVRAGGPLDPVGNPSGAMRSMSAAMQDVSGAAAALLAFRSRVLEPIQAAALSKLAEGAGVAPASARGALELAADVRSRLSTGAALAGAAAERVLVLIGGRRL